MQIHLVHEFNCTPADVWEITRSEEFDRRRKEGSATMDREVREERVEDGVEIQVVRISSNKKLPTLVAKAIRRDRIVYDQETRLQRSKNLLHWTIEPLVLTGRVDAAGTTTIEAMAKGCRRIIDGHITIRVALIGKKLEKTLCENIEAGFERNAALVCAILEERSG
jgi:hypothetical protein